MLGPKADRVPPPFLQLDRYRRVVLPPVVVDRCDAVQLRLTGRAAQSRFDERLVALRRRYVRHAHLEEELVSAKGLGTVAEEPRVDPRAKIAHALVAHHEM